MSHPAKLCSTIKQACTQLLLAGLKVVQFCDKFVRVRPSLARRDLAAVFVYAKAQLPLFVNKIIEFYKALKYATAGLDAGIKQRFCYKLDLLANIIKALYLQACDMILPLT